nr:MAG TPA: hypothetical protein [Caudoviricetes sp.]
MKTVRPTDSFLLLENPRSSVGGFPVSAAEKSEGVCTRKR